MKIEDVARVGLAARRPAEQKRHLPISRGVLGKIVVDAEGMAARVAEELRHGAAGIGSQVLQRRRLRGRGDDDRRIRHGARVLEDLHDLGDGGAFLADGDVEAVDPLPFLVDDSVHADSGLARAAVADDELALAASDGDHGVDGLEPRLKRLLDGASVHHAGGVALERAELAGGDWPLPVYRLAERVDDATGQRLAHRHLGDALGTRDVITLLDEGVRAEQHGADVVFLEIEHEAIDVARELQELAGHGAFEAIDAGDAVAHLEDTARFLEVDRGLVALQLLLDDLADLFRLDHAYPLTSRSRRRASCPSRLPSRMRLPTWATKPPRRCGSVVSSRITCLPTAACRRLASWLFSPSVNEMLVRTWARTRPSSASTRSR